MTSTTSYRWGSISSVTRIFPVADVLTALRVPFAFVSGHPRTLMPPHLHGHAFIAKPFGQGQIIATVKELLS